jgi:hypothetical protein
MYNTGCELRLTWISAPDQCRLEHARYACFNRFVKGRYGSVINSRLSEYGSYIFDVRRTCSLSAIGLQNHCCSLIERFVLDDIPSAVQRNMRGHFRPIEQLNLQAQEHEVLPLSLGQVGEHLLLTMFGKFECDTAATCSFCLF